MGQSALHGHRRESNLNHCSALFQYPYGDHLLFYENEITGWIGPTCVLFSFVFLRELSVDILPNINPFPCDSHEAELSNCVKFYAILQGEVEKP
ncbi:MAG: hypothetical protein EA364_02485 [Balneolaceae bacterium]|nr:MAG: hypothetical protein EA364_02485 [Balneolaceae bacterium]